MSLIRQRWSYFNDSFFLLNFLVIIYCLWMILCITDTFYFSFLNLDCESKRQAELASDRAGILSCTWITTRLTRSVIYRQRQKFYYITSLIMMTAFNYWLSSAPMFLCPRSLYSMGVHGNAPVSLHKIRLMMRTLSTYTKSWSNASTCLLLTHWTATSCWSTMVL